MGNLFNIFSDPKTLHEAAWSGNLADVREILERGDVIVDARDSYGFTAFSLACQRHHVGVMRALLDAGADVNLMWDSGAFLYPVGAALHDAVMPALGCEQYGASSDCCAAAVRLLLEAGARVDLRTGDGKTALYLACKSYPPAPFDLVSLLLQYGADVNAECGPPTAVRWRETPLEAVMYWIEAAIPNDVLRELRLALLDLLVAHVRPDSDLQPSLCRAAGRRRGSTARVRMFLDLGASPNDAPEGQASPLHCSCRCGNHEVAQLLLDAGADVNAVDPEGQGSLTWVVNGENMVKVQNRLDTAKLLISRGADVNQSDHEGRTPLHWAVAGDFQSKQRIVRLLLQSGADPRLRDAEGRTPLSTLCQSLVPGHHFDLDDRTAADLVYMLLQGGAEVEEMGEDGLAATVVMNGRELTLEELLHHQSDVLPDYD